MSEQAAVAPPPERRFSSPTTARALGFGRTRVGIAVTAAIVLVALIGPLVSRYDPSALVGIPLQPPSGDYPLGTDYLGHDVLSRLLWGGRSVVWMAFAAATLGVGLGAALGMLAGFSRSRLDDGLMRSMDVILAFPQIVLVLLFVSMLGSHLSLIVALVALAWVPQVARVARGVTADIVHREYVQAAEAIGLPRRRILFRRSYRTSRRL